MFHLLILLENISWTLLQLLNVDHGFCKGDLMPVTKRPNAARTPRSERSNYSCLNKRKVLCR